MEKDKICKLCTGCRTCERVCPKKAIVMKENFEGFLEPQIDEEKCINCNLCKKRCPQNRDIISKEYLGKTYAAQINNDTILKESSSGGFFSVLAKEIINKNGVVFGATMTEDLKVQHISIKKEEELKKIRSSKYVASDTLNTFREAKKYLDNGIEVLYSGLPCQIAGLKSFLNKDYDNLITVDVICHGTPSYKLFEVYKNGIERLKKSKISNYKFRDKSKYGWGVYWSYLYNNGKKQKSGGLNDDPYCSAFIKGIANKESCYECKYVGFENRPADITLGDYWGIDKVHPEMASNKGVSAVIVNSNKAMELVKNCLKNCRYIESNKESVAKYNPSLVLTIDRPNYRDKVYNGIYTKKPEIFIRENLKISYKDFVKTKIRLLLPYELRIKIKKVIKSKMEN